MKKMPLGKGLSALISDIEEVDTTGTVEVPIDKIKTNQFQPRKYFNEEKLNDLISSIKERGVIQPVLVRKLNNGFYELIAGERRFRAASTIGLKTIPCVIREASNSDALELALIENIQREDLNPIEEANAYQQLIEEFKITHEELSKRVGKDRVTITNSLRLLKLPDDVKEHVSRGDISSGHARTLLGLDNEATIKALCVKIIQKDISVRETENIVNNIKSGKIKQGKIPAQIDPHQREIEDELKRLLGTKVRIHHRKNKGRIEIEYYSYEDLERILEILRK